MKQFFQWLKQEWATLIIWLMAGGLLVLFIYSFYSAGPDVKAGLLGFLAAVFATLFSHRQTKQREIASRHFTEKREAYMKFIDIFFDLLEGVKKDKPINPKKLEQYEKKATEKLTKDMMKFTKSLTVWGSHEMVMAWNEFTVNAEEAALDVGKMATTIEKILRAIRKDLGHEDDELPVGQLWALILDKDGKEKVLESMEKDY